MSEKKEPQFLTWWLGWINDLAMAREVLNTPKTLTLKTFEKSSCVNSAAGLTTDTPAFLRWIQSWPVQMKGIRPTATRPTTFPSKSESICFMVAFTNCVSATSH